MNNENLAGEKPLDEQSPDEKLQSDEQKARPVPGAENPDSEEIKDEVNLNTE
ncbi:MAG: hypothetical protein MSG64_20090 [Pyrinomonadaceae bacterium MAG19_C2-C3]|nr:hypothetical protein [Pyrinomonadaceae bacterium MAG19_C2-C3]